MAQRMSITPGLSLDLTTIDEYGKPWDFNDPRQRKRAEDIVKTQKCALLVVSPRCASFSTMNRINYARLSAERVKELKEYGRTHLEFAMHLCRIQHQQGLYYLFEHPRYASSWQEKCVIDMINKHGGVKTNADLCQYGMKIKDLSGDIKPAKKPTTFLTNAPQVAG